MILKAKRWRRKLSDTSPASGLMAAPWVDVEAEIRPGHDGKPWLFLLNGPTGYESMPISEWPTRRRPEKPGGWMANFGGGGYDALWLPDSQLEKAYNFALTTVTDTVT